MAFFPAGTAATAAAAAMPAMPAMPAAPGLVMTDEGIVVPDPRKCHLGNVKANQVMPGSRHNDQA